MIQVVQFTESRFEKLSFQGGFSALIKCTSQIDYSFKKIKAMEYFHSLTLHDRAAQMIDLRSVYWVFLYLKIRNMAQCVQFAWCNYMPIVNAKHIDYQLILWRIVKINCRYVSQSYH